MKVKTADLIGPTLDWAVAKAQGREEIRIFGRTCPRDRGWIEVRFNPEPRANTARFDPSINWGQGGPIIEREGISIRQVDDRTWRADFSRAVLKADGSAYAFLQKAAPTPLIAAMRCFVASRLGDEVDIPDELV